MVRQYHKNGSMVNRELDDYEKFRQEKIMEEQQEREMEYKRNEEESRRLYMEKMQAMQAPQRQSPVQPPIPERVSAEKYQT